MMHTRCKTMKLESYRGESKERVKRDADSRVAILSLLGTFRFAYWARQFFRTIRRSDDRLHDRRAEGPTF